MPITSSISLFFLRERIRWERLKKEREQKKLTDRRLKIEKITKRWVSDYESYGETMWDLFKRKEKERLIERRLKIEKIRKNEF